ncbi:MAG: hypothetical protein QW706_07855 [Candidatus Nezhaarchaeales archaeon]
MFSKGRKNILRRVNTYMVAIGPRLRRQGCWLLVVYTRGGGTYRVVTVIDAKNPDHVAKRREEKGRWVRVW